MIGVSALAGAVALLSSCSNSSSSNGAERTVTFVSYGGSGQEAETHAWLDPYAEQNGVKVIQDTTFSTAKFKAMVESGNVVWDVSQGGALFNLSGDNPDLEQIDCDIVSCSDFDDGPFQASPQGVPVYYFSYTLTYNPSKISDPKPAGLQDFFDTAKWPGKRALDVQNGLAGMLEFALVADGVPRDQLYPLDVDRALKKFDSIRDSLIFVKDPDECVNDVASGEAVMGTCYDARVSIAQAEGKNIDQAWGTQVRIPSFLIIPKGTPHLDEAQKLIAYITSAEHNGDLLDYAADSPANPKAKVEGKFASDAAANHVETGDQAPIAWNQKWWAANYESIGKKVADWMTK